MLKTLAFVCALALGLSGCNVTSFNAGLTTTTTNLMALDNALIQVNITIVNNLAAQAKLLAPYACGAYAFTTQILVDSGNATAVNNYLSQHVTAQLANVAVKDICAALGYPATVTSATAVATK